MPPFEADTEGGKFNSMPDSSPRIESGVPKSQGDVPSVSGDSDTAAAKAGGAAGSSPLGKRVAEAEGGRVEAKKQATGDKQIGQEPSTSVGSALSMGRSWGPNVAVQPSAAISDNVLRMLLQERSASASLSPGPSATSEQALLRELSVQQMIQQQAARNVAAAQLVSSLTNPSLAGAHVGNMLPLLNVPGMQPFVGTQQDAARSHYSQLLGLPPLSDLAMLGGSLRSATGLSPSASLQNASLLSSERQDVSPLIRELEQRNRPAAPLQTGGIPSGGGITVAPLVRQRSLGLPPCQEGRLQSFSKRASFPLGIDEDPNWLSEFHCFVRSELIEVFRASREDCKARNNSIAYQQVGIRCRFCAHLDQSARAGRSSAFPSSLNQIYQSFTMMLRDHFGNCEVTPTAYRDKFLALKDKPAQGATDSKRFWVYSAMKIGMDDSPKGIIVTEQTLAVGSSAAPFGTVPGQPWVDDKLKNVPIVLPSDRPLVSDFLFLLMSQTQLVRLTEPERIGNRRSLRIGLPGFGCRYCCEHRRLGLCRMFPARRRTLPGKINDLYDHLRRCSLCPENIKEQLELTKHQMNQGMNPMNGGDREFFDRIWNRLGHGSQSP